jgi:hypothetical protein
MSTAATDTQPGLPHAGPATSADIRYRAYRRPYDAQGGQVIILLASCSYTVGQYEIYFVGGGGDGADFVLMQQPPLYLDELLTYYSASYASGLGLNNLGNTVSIRDAHGVHEVALENM